MILNRLNIELQKWGANEGKYEVEISVTENRNEIKMVLPSEIGVALIGQVKDFIHEFSKKAADDLHRELQIAAPAPKAIEA